MSSSGSRIATWVARRRGRERDDPVRDDRGHDLDVDRAVDELDGRRRWSRPAWPRRPSAPAPRRRRWPVPVALRPSSNVSTSWSEQRGRVDGRRGRAEHAGLREDRGPGRGDRRIRELGGELGLERGLERGQRRVDVLLGDLGELLARPAGRRVRVQDVEGDRVLAARDHGDRVRLDVARRPLVDGRHLDRSPSSGRPCTPTMSARPTVIVCAVRKRTPDGVLTMLPPGMVFDEVKSRLRNRTVPGRRRLLDPLPGRRERVGGGDVDVDQLGRDHALDRVGRRCGRVGHDGHRDRADGLLPSGSRRSSPRGGTGRRRRPGRGRRTRARGRRRGAASASPPPEPES